MSLLIFVLALSFAFAVVPAFADEGDIPGPVETDQSPYTVDEVVSNAANPVPMSPTGPAPPGSYTTELWSDGETDTEYGLQVVSSSALGTAALTGVAQDEITGYPISGATVLISCSLCSQPIGTTTDSAGAFAFINLPADVYNLSVSAVGYGLFQSMNGTYAADDQYEITAELNADAQTYDESAPVADVVQTPGGVETAPLGAHTRVPPAIRVAKVIRNPDCTYNRTPDPLPVVNYKWDFYVLHVLNPEVGGLGYNQAAMRSFEAMVQNYAWYHKLLGGIFDVDWSARYQCFRPHARVARTWRTWLQDVLDERVANAVAGRITETLYEKGAYLAANCAPDTKHPPDGGKASQLGISSLTTLGACGPLTDWRTVIGYYYVPSVVTGTVPSNPVTSFTRPPGSIAFTFQSYAGLFHLAWGYEIDKKVGPGQWTRIYRRGWSRTNRSVPTSWTYSPPGGQCAKYRARAYNPVGYSVYSSFNGGNSICPG